MTEHLFGGRVPPACRYCEEAMQTTGTHALCIRKGVVPLDYACRKYTYDPLKRVPQRPMPLEVFQAEDFSID